MLCVMALAPAWQAPPAPAEGLPRAEPVARTGEETGVQALAGNPLSTDARFREVTKECRVDGFDMSDVCFLDDARLLVAYRGSEGEGTASAIYHLATGELHLRKHAVSMPGWPQAALLPDGGYALYDPSGATALLVDAAAGETVISLGETPADSWLPYDSDRLLLTRGPALYWLAADGTQTRLGSLDNYGQSLSLLFCTAQGEIGVEAHRDNGDCTALRFTVADSTARPLDGAAYWALADGGTFAAPDETGRRVRLYRDGQTPQETALRGEWESAQALQQGLLLTTQRGYDWKNWRETVSVLRVYDLTSGTMRLRSQPISNQNLDACGADLTPDGAYGAALFCDRQNRRADWERGLGGMKERLVLWEVPTEGEDEELRREAGPFGAAALSDDVLAEVQRVYADYGVQLLAGNDDPWNYQTYFSGAYTTEAMTDENMLWSAARMVRNTFKHFPAGMVREVYQGCPLKIFLTGAIDAPDESEAETAGFFFSQGTEHYIVLDVGQTELSWTIAHELYHSIEDRMNRKAGGDAFAQWETYLPDGFAYYGSYDDSGWINDAEAERYTTFDERAWRRNEVYFLNPYSKTYEDEDRAEIFAYLFLYDEMDEWFLGDPVSEKAAAVCGALRQQFSSAAREETPHWERGMQAAGLLAVEPPAAA